MFEHLEKVQTDRAISIANHQTLKIEGKGHIVLKTGEKRMESDVTYVPGLAANLFS